MKLSKKALVNITTAKELIYIAVLFLIGKPKQAFHRCSLLRLYRLANSMTKAETLQMLAYYQRKRNIIENELKEEKEKTTIRGCLSNYNSLFDVENKETEKHEELSSESNEEKNVSKCAES